MPDGIWRLRPYLGYDWIAGTAPQCRRSSPCRASAALLCVGTRSGPVCVHVGPLHCPAPLHPLPQQPQRPGRSSGFISPSLSISDAAARMKY